MAIDSIQTTLNSSFESNLTSSLHYEENGDILLYFWVGIIFRPKNQKSLRYILGDLDPIQKA